MHLLLLVSLVVAQLRLYLGLSKVISMRIRVILSALVALISSETTIPVHDLLLLICITCRSLLVKNFRFFLFSRSCFRILGLLILLVYYFFRVIHSILCIVFEALAL